MAMWIILAAPAYSPMLTNQSQSLIIKRYVLAALAATKMQMMRRRKKSKVNTDQNVGVVFMEKQIQSSNCSIT
jgi:hypothetical protein